MVTNPIWKDTEYTSSTSSLTYYIKVDGNIIFNGRAYREPDATGLTINVNRVCQNYLSNELPEAFTGVTSATYTNGEAVKDFLLYNSNGTLLETYRLSYDWSYDSATTGSPINGHYASNQKVINTTKGTSAYTNTITTANTNYCGDYAIYYLDSYGCWKSFLFEGNCKMADNFTQYEYNKSFKNTTVQFEKGRYISEIETSYELSTGWLTDEQSYNFSRNLVGTNMAYLHNLKTNRISPIIIDEQSIDYKEYRTNGNHLVEYTINVKESQNRIRK